MKSAFQQGEQIGYQSHDPQVEMNLSVQLENAEKCIRQLRNQVNEVSMTNEEQQTVESRLAELNGNLEDVEIELMGQEESDIADKLPRVLIMTEIPDDWRVNLLCGSYVNDQVQGTQEFDQFVDRDNVYEEQIVRIIKKRYRGLLSDGMQRYGMSKSEFTLSKILLLLIEEIMDEVHRMTIEQHDMRRMVGFVPKEVKHFRRRMTKAKVLQFLENQPLDVEDEVDENDPFLEEWREVQRAQRAQVLQDIRDIADSDEESQEEFAYDEEGNQIVSAEDALYNTEHTNEERYMMTMYMNYIMKQIQAEVLIEMEGALVMRQLE